MDGEGLSGPRNLPSMAVERDIRPHCQGPDDKCSHVQDGTIMLYA